MKEKEIEISEIIRSKRKTFGIIIRENGEVIVKCPLNATPETIYRVIKKHRDWILRKRKEILERDHKFTKKEFVNGEGFLYLGRSYKLTIVEDQTVPLKFRNGFYLSKDYLPVARSVFIEWYKQKAKEKIPPRVRYYANLKGIEYNKINITHAQKRWGSCSSQKNLNFSWRLIMAPISIIDYVIVHELVHLEVPNHSPIFWGKVKTLLPDYEKRIAWLNKNGHLLNI